MTIPDDRATDAPSRARESPLGVVGIALGFALLAGCLGALAALGRPDPELDAAALLEERFARAGELPFGLRPVAALRDHEQREVVTLAGDRATALDSGAPSARASAAAQPSAGGDPAHPGGPAWIDWDALPVAASDAAPARGALVWYPRERAEDVMRDLFTSLRFEGADGPADAAGGAAAGRSGGPPGGRGGPGDPGDPGDEPEAPEPKLQDGGTLTWAGYAAPYVRLREFELEDGRPSFRETVRVNLTVGPWCCVLFLGWPAGEAGSLERTLEVLAELEPQDPSSPKAAQRAGGRPGTRAD